MPPGPTAIRWTRRVLARASILEETSTVSPLLCYSSGGYEKLVFDVVLGEPVEVEVLQSALAGDPRCRFRIKLQPLALSRHSRFISCRPFSIPGTNSSEAACGLWRPAPLLLPWPPVPRSRLARPGADRSPAPSAPPVG